MKSFIDTLKIIGTGLAAVVACIVMFAVLLLILFVSTSSRELIGQYPSGDQKHTIYVYLCDSGATTPWTIVCDVKGSHILGKRRIYAKDDIDTAAVTWLDDRTVEINGITLDIYEDKYPDQDN